MRPPVVERSSLLYYLTLDPSQFGFFLEPYRPGQSSAVTAADVLATDPTALAVVDGAMASACGSEFDAANNIGVSSAQIRHVHPCRTLDYRYFDRAAGIDVPGRFPRVGITLGVAGGRAFASPTSVVPADADIAVQLYPSIVENGVNIGNDNVGSNGERRWRGGLGILPNGRIVYAIGQASMRTFAQAMIALGCLWVGYLDGGGSASMQVRGGERLGAREDRPVASFLVVRDVNELAVIGANAPKIIGVGLAIAAVGTGLYLWWTSRR